MDPAGQRPGEDGEPLLLQAEASAAELLARGLEDPAQPQDSGGPRLAWSGPSALGLPAPRARSRVLLRGIVDADGAPPPPVRCPALSGNSVGVAIGGALLLAAGLTLQPWSPRGAAAGFSRAPGAHATSLALQCRRVACLGTSMTAGRVSIPGGLASKTPYPKILQDLLGPGYCVNNYGVPDTTVLKDTSSPYWNRPEMEHMKQVPPDIVILQFGARDTMENEFDRNFRGDYGSMIQWFKKLPSRPQVYIMAIPPIYPGTASSRHPGSAYGMNIAHVNMLRLPLEQIAKENRIAPPISVFNSFQSKCPDMKLKCGWLSKDGVHPNEKGDKAIAKLIFMTVKGSDHCIVSADEREACGESGQHLTQQHCRDLGCCYVAEAPAGAQQCFRKARTMHASPLQCLVGPTEKTECGYQGDDMDTCMARGCCYKPSLDGSPWCFHKEQKATAAVAVLPSSSESSGSESSDSTISSESSDSKPVRKATTTTVTRTSTTVTGTTTTATQTTTRTVTVTVTTTQTSTITSTVTTTTTQTSTTMTFTGTSTVTSTTTTTATSTTTTTTTGLSSLQLGFRKLTAASRSVAGNKAVLAVGGLALLAALGGVCCCALRPPGPAVSEGEVLDSIHLQEDEEQRQLRRLEVDMVLRRVEENRLQRELDATLAAAGFTGVNEPKATKGMFRSGHTYPLHAAVEANSVEAVQMLVRAQADVTALDSKKRTALQLAESLNKRESHQEVIQLLREAA